MRSWCTTMKTGTRTECASLSAILTARLCCTSLRLAKPPRPAGKMNEDAIRELTSLFQTRSLGEADASIRPRGHACVRLPTNTRHFAVPRYLARRAVFRCGRSRYREAASPSSFCAANSVNSFISGIRERSSVSTSGQSISIRFLAGSYIWTQPSGSSFTGLRNAVESSAPIAFAAS